MGDGLGLPWGERPAQVPILYYCTYFIKRWEMQTASLFLLAPLPLHVNANCLSFEPFCSFVRIVSFVWTVFFLCVLRYSEDRELPRGWKVEMLESPIRRWSRRFFCTLLRPQDRWEKFWIKLCSPALFWQQRSPLRSLCSCASSLQKQEVGSWPLAAYRVRWLSCASASLTLIPLVLLFCCWYCNS